MKKYYYNSFLIQYDLFLRKRKKVKLEMFVDVYVTYNILLYYIVST